MTTVNPDIDAIDSPSTRLFLSGAGMEVEVERLRTRQFFKLIRILTVGAGPLLAEIQISSDSDPEELTSQLSTLLLLSVAEAEEEVMDFLKSMVKPIGLIEERSKADREVNVQKYTELYKALDNPEAEDTLDLLMKIIEIETPNLKALGKKIAAILPSAAKQTTSSKKRSKAQTPTTS